MVRTFPAPRRRPLLGGLVLSCLSLLYFLSTAATLSSAASTPSRDAGGGGSGVIGIDLGTKFLKAVLVKPGIPLEIVLTKDSKRKEPATVAFKPAPHLALSDPDPDSDANANANVASFPERFYGSDALALATRFPDDVYANLKSLLGVSFDTGVAGTRGENAAKSYAKRYPSLRMEGIDDRGTIGFKSSKVAAAAKDGQAPFMVEELLAMQLKQVRQNAESMGGDGASVRDAVITFPSFYTVEEKRSLHLAAELAGLNVMAFISDGMAVGLNYATTRSFPSVSDGHKPEHHIIFDMGAGSTTASVVRFQSQNVKVYGRTTKPVQEAQVLGTGWDKTLGGESLNELIMDDMIAKYISAGKLKQAGATEAQFRSHGRTLAKLLKEAERVRHVLSANSETHASFEDLYHEGVSFKYSLTRSEFEGLAAEHISRVSIPLKDALATANLTFADIDSIILHGGASRTPFVSRALEAACGDAKKLRGNVNADESAAFGAAFRGAALHPSFRVKEIIAWDTVSFPVAMSYPTTGEKTRTQKLFPANSKLGVEKEVTIKPGVAGELTFDLSQQIPPAGHGQQPFDIGIISARTENLVQSVKTLSEKPGCEAANIMTKFGVRLRSSDGLPELSRASVNCEISKDEKKKGAGGVVEDVKKFFDLGGKKNDEQQKPIGEKPESSPSEESTTVESAHDTATVSSSSSSETPASSTSADSKASSSSTPAASNSAQQAHTESIPLKLTTTSAGSPRPLSAQEMTRIVSRLSSFDASDSARIQREETFNILEGSIYRMRDLITSYADAAAATTTADDDDADGKVVLKTASASFPRLAQQLAGIAQWMESDGAHANTKGLRAGIDDLLFLQVELFDAVVNAGVKSVDDVAETETKRTESLVDAVDAKIAGLKKEIARLLRVLEDGDGATVKTWTAKIAQIVEVWQAKKTGLLEASKGGGGGSSGAKESSTNTSTSSNSVPTVTKGGEAESQKGEAEGAGDDYTRKSKDEL